MRKPNILLIITDDQGYGDLSCNGNTIIKTPYIDKLYEESVRLTNFHVGPTCAPTRAGLLTGRYCNCTGVWHTIGGRSLIRKDEVTIADILKMYGYKTGLFGKWHLGDNYPFRPNDRGFDIAISHGGGGIGQTPDYWGNDYFDDTYSVNGKKQKYNGYCTDVWFQEAAKFIEDCKDDPFFCLLATNAPHHPYHVEVQYSSQYYEKVPTQRANFYGMISCIDDNIGRIRSQLEKLNIADNTILIFMTDNGTSCGCEINEEGFVVQGYNANMRGMKGSEYEGGHRVPFFLSWPDGGYHTGRDITELTANIDVLPTLVELCSIRIPNEINIHGKSLVPLLSKTYSDWPERVIVTDSQRVEQPIKWKQSATMTQKWRLVNGTELYDIADDPGQLHNVAGNFPEVVEKLRKHYEDWWMLVSERFNDNCPIVVGADQEKESTLSSHDWHGEQCAWNQGQVREGIECHGYWLIETAKDGIYSFELRRWPQEENRSITDGIPGSEINWYQGGRAMKLISAKIKIDGIEIEKSIGKNSICVEFKVHLTKGVKKLWASFLSDKGIDIGAYYVYIKPCS